MERKVALGNIFAFAGYMAAALFWFCFILLLLGLSTTPREGGSEHIFSSISLLYNHGYAPWLVVGWWLIIAYMSIVSCEQMGRKGVFKWITIGMMIFITPLVIQLVWM